MFRFTIYTIVAYAFWLTFVDVSHYLGKNSVSSWLSDIKRIWVNEDEITPQQDLSQLAPHHCEPNNSCYAQGVPMGE